MCIALVCAQGQNACYEVDVDSLNQITMAAGWENKASETHANKGDDRSAVHIDPVLAPLPSAHCGVLRLIRG